MKTALVVLQLIVSIILIGTILMQNAKGGLGSAFGGGGEFRTKRGAELIVFRATIVLAVLFFLLSIANLLV